MKLVVPALVLMLALSTRVGKVIDGTPFYDSISFNDLWTRVQPRSRFGAPGTRAR